MCVVYLQENSVKAERPNDGTKNDEKEYDGCASWGV